MVVEDLRSVVRGTAVRVKRVWAGEEEVARARRGGKCGCVVEERGPRNVVEGLCGPQCAVPCYVLVYTLREAPCRVNVRCGLC